jgi:hypothetical protein
MSTENPARPAVRAPYGELERSLIDQYLRARGHDPAHLDALPEPVRDALLKEASTYASAKLTEVESRSHLIDAMHDGVPGARGTGLD